MAKTKKPKALSLIQQSLIGEPMIAAGPDRPLCQKCGLDKTTTNPYTNPKPNPNWTGKVLVLGEAAGAEEEKSGKYFVGKSGKILRQYLSEAGLSLGTDGAPPDVEFWNSVRCRPPDNATPSMEQIRCCRPFAVERIKDLKPTIVLVVGASALKSTKNQGDGSIAQNRGRPLEFKGAVCSDG